MKIGIIVVSHYSNIYKHFDAIRRDIFTREKIPCIFSYNGEHPEIPLPWETVYRESGMHPMMYNKFIQTYMDIPELSDVDFIVRVNSSTFLSPKPLIKLINSLPTANCYAGPKLGHDPDACISGMCIIFSRDVMNKLCERGLASDNIPDDVNIGNFMRSNGINYTDTDLSKIKRIQLEPGFVNIINNNTILPEEHEIYSQMIGQPITRIKNENRLLDTQIWNILYSKYIYENRN